MRRLTVATAEKWFPEVLLHSITVDSELLIERAYRTCWRSDSRPDVGAFITSCITRGHLSPLEFADATFMVDASRAMTHQLVRHRIASYAQESQRFVFRNNETEVVIPPKIFENEDALELFVMAISFSWRAYFGLIKCGIAKEDARYVLPTACKSVIFVKMNFRSWRHFLKLRCARAAQWEIRGVAREILRVLYKNAPSVFGDLYESCILGKRISLWTESD